MCQIRLTRLLLIAGIFLVSLVFTPKRTISQNLNLAIKDVIKATPKKELDLQRLLGLTIPDNADSSIPKTLFSTLDKLFATDGEAHDGFGQSVDISGDTIVIGAPGADIDGISNQGAAYIFSRSNGNWSQEAKLVADDGESVIRFGQSVAIWEDTIVIGAPRTGFDTGQSSAFIFTKKNDTWTQQAKLIPNGGSPGAWFGISVAIHQDTVVIGDIEGFDPGAAYVFTRLDDTWSQQAKLIANDGHFQAFFGVSVATEENTIIVGSPGSDINDNNEQGATYLFTRSGDIWTQQVKLTAEDGTEGDWFGRSVSMDGNIIAVGQPRGFIHPKGYGAAYTFVRSGNNWTQQAKLTADDRILEDYFGFSISISENRIIVGTTDVFINTPETAYIFNYSEDSWSQSFKLTNDGPDGAFAYSVGIDGNFVIVGAPSTNIGAHENQGAAYIFRHPQLYLPLIMQ